MKKIAIIGFIFFIVAVLLFSTCGKQKSTFDEEDLLGEWRTDLIGEECTILFYADGDEFLYKTTNFFDRGQYLVTKHGEVVLRDRYGDQRRLSVQTTDEAIHLHYLDGLVSYVFTTYPKKGSQQSAENESRQEEVERPEQTEHSEGGLLAREKLDLYGEAAKRILEHGPWDGVDSSQKLIASDSTINVYGWQEDYVITAAGPINGGIEVHLKSISGEYIVQIIETRDTQTSEGEWTYPTGYKLLISYNGGEWTAFFREGYVSMSTG